MSQHDMNIANQGFPAFRADLNSALGALATTSAGATEPSTTFANQFWYDSTDNLLKMRNSDNDAWITLAYFDQAADEWEVRSAVIQAVDSAGVSIKTDDGTTRIEVQDDGDVAIDTNTLFVDATNNRVGIGTSSPSNTFHVSASSGDAIARIEAAQNVGTSDAQLRLQTESTIASGIIAFGDSDDDFRGIINYDNGDDSMRISTAGSERMRIDSGGAVSVSTTASTFGGRTFHMGVERPGTGLNDCFSLYYATTGTTSQLIRGHSNVGGTETAVFVVRTDGDVQNTNNSYTAISDERLKQDIVDANSQWNDIKALQVKNYRLKDRVAQSGDDAPTHLGLIAQDLEASGMSGLVATYETEYWEEGEELPEGVSVGDVKTEEVKTVKYSILYMKAVKALQEAMERIETLEARVSALES